MPNIVMTRIDNYLIHSRITAQWFGATGANLIIVANDDVAVDKMRQALMDMAAPSYISVRYWSIQKAIETIHMASERQKIFIVCEKPFDVLRLVEGGVPITKVSVGYMYMTEGKRQITPSVAVDDNDVAVFAKLRRLGVELEMRRIPAEPADDIEKLFR